MTSNPAYLARIAYLPLRGENYGVSHRRQSHRPRTQLILAGPDARLDCVLDHGGAFEVRVPHDQAAKLPPRERVRLIPRHVRVWTANA